MTVIYYQDEEANIEKLERKKIRLKALVKKFKNDNEEYLKIEKKQSNRLQALYLSLYSLMESREQILKKYSKLIYPWS
jgi:ribonuclease I